MSTHTVACIGTGAKEDLTSPGREGFAMNYYHAEGYERLESCELVACADLIVDRAEEFADEFDIPTDGVYEDYKTMLEAVEPSVVSISVWPDSHADIVIDCARTESVEAIHCEKPMDKTWANSKRMAAVCAEEDVQLTFNHMRRFKPTWVEARKLIDGGEIGDLERVELAPGNIYDGGTHEIDFVTGVVGDRPVKWVIGQIDYRKENKWFGIHNENQAIAHWEYENGVKGVLASGDHSSLVPALMRFVGTEGILDIAPENGDGGTEIRWRTTADETWTRRTIDEGSWVEPTNDAIAHAIECLESGAQPTIGAQNALNGTELIFGIWESARGRGRVEFPLEIADNPLEDLVDAGELDLQ